MPCLWSGGKLAGETEAVTYDDLDNQGCLGEKCQSTCHMDLNVRDAMLAKDDKDGRDMSAELICAIKKIMGLLTFFVTTPVKASCPRKCSIYKRKRNMKNEVEWSCRTCTGNACQ